MTDFLLFQRRRRAYLNDPPGKSLEGTHPALAEKWRRVHSRHASHTNSARRYTADQQLFWDCYQTRLNTGNCPPSCNRSQCSSANPPGSSNHEFGLAIDGEPQDGDWAAWGSVCEQEGLNRIIQSEPWHLQDERTTTGAFSGYFDDWRA